MSLSVIVPVYNEINYLKIFIKRLLSSFEKENVQYIFINDGSNDGSEEWLSNNLQTLQIKNYKYVNLSKNRGKGYALRQGLKFVTCDYILFIDSDMEYDSRDGFEMYQIIKNNSQMEVLFGSRYITGKIQHREYFFNDIAVRINTIIFNFLFGQSISDLHCGTKIISKKVLNNINLSIDDFGFEIDISSKIAKSDFKIYEYGISYIARSYKQGKKITWIDGLLSYGYLFKTRIIENELNTLISILYSFIYMGFIGSYFGMGSGKILAIIFFSIIGIILGLKRKLTTLSIVFLFIYLGSLFSNGNGRIYTVLIFFMISIYLTKKISLIIKKITNNKFINYFI